MNTLRKIVESKIRIQYQDCDPFNHLNNSKYIDCIVAARTEQLLDNYNFNTADILQKHGVGWVAAQTQISYIYPAIWLENVIVETRLIAFSEFSLLVEGIMWNDSKSQIKAIMWGKLVHFNIKTQRSHKHSPEFMNLFDQIHYPIENNKDFNDRVKILKQLNQ